MDPRSFQLQGQQNGQQVSHQLSQQQSLPQGVIFRLAGDNGNGFLHTNQASQQTQAQQLVAQQPMQQLQQPLQPQFHQPLPTQAQRVDQLSNADIVALLHSRGLIGAAASNFPAAASLGAAAVADVGARASASAGQSVTETTGAAPMNASNATCSAMESAAASLTALANSAAERAPIPTGTSADANGNGENDIKPPAASLPLNEQNLEELERRLVAAGVPQASCKFERQDRKSGFASTAAQDNLPSSSSTGKVAPSQGSGAKNPSNNDKPEKKPGSLVLPCRARGMPMDHNVKSAYFVIPENVVHGQELICSHEACRSAGVKFCYCAYCEVAVARRNFRKRHKHLDEDDLPVGRFTGEGNRPHPSDTGDPDAMDPDEIEQSGVAPVANAIDNTGSNSNNNNYGIPNQVSAFKSNETVEEPKENSASKPKNLVSSQSDTTSILSGERTKLIQAKIQQWVDLLASRPYSKASEAMSEWLMNVVSLSDPATPLEEAVKNVSFTGSSNSQSGKQSYNISVTVGDLGLLESAMSVNGSTNNLSSHESLNISGSPNAKNDERSSTTDSTGSGSSTNDSSSDTREDNDDRMVSNKESYFAETAKIGTSSSSISNSGSDTRKVKEMSNGSTSDNQEASTYTDSLTYSREKSNNNTSSTKAKDGERSSTTDSSARGSSTSDSSTSESSSDCGSDTNVSVGRKRTIEGSKELKRSSSSDEDGYRSDYGERRDRKKQKQDTDSNKCSGGTPTLFGSKNSRNEGGSSTNNSTSTSARDAGESSMNDSGSDTRERWQ